MWTLFYLSIRIPLSLGRSLISTLMSSHPLNCQCLRWLNVIKLKCWGKVFYALRGLFGCCETGCKNDVDGIFWSVQGICVILMAWLFALSCRILIVKSQTAQQRIMNISSECIQRVFFVFAWCAQEFEFCQLRESTFFICYERDLFAVCVLIHYNFNYVHRSRMSNEWKESRQRDSVEVGKQRTLDDLRMIYWIARSFINKRIFNLKPKQFFISKEFFLICMNDIFQFYHEVMNGEKATAEDKAAEIFLIEK